MQKPLPKPGDYSIKHRTSFEYPKDLRNEPRKQLILVANLVKMSRLCIRNLWLPFWLYVSSRSTLSLAYTRTSRAIELLTLSISEKNSPSIIRMNCISVLIGGKIDKWHSLSDPEASESGTVDMQQIGEFSLLAGITGRLSTFLHGRSTPSCMLAVGSAAPHYSGVQCRLDIQLHWISISAKEVSLLWVPWMVVVRSHPLINLLYAMKSILSR